MADLERKPKAGITMPAAGPRNRYLADSVYPIAHGRCDQQDNDVAIGPTGPTETLAEADMTYAPVGAGHFGSAISSPYPDGKRVIWSNGREQICKLDYDTMEILATLPVPGYTVTPTADFEAAIDTLDASEGDDAINHALGLALTYLQGIDGVYFVLDADNTLFLGGREAVSAFADDFTDRHSPIVERGRWEKPPEVTGHFAGAGMTFDGRLVMSTDHGWLVCLDRDFNEYVAIQITGAEHEAQAWTEKMLAERGNGGYGWVRTSICTEDLGDGRTAVYLSSRDHTHKIIWTGSELSTNEADGAWVAQYSNSAGYGSGTTPCLMGFGDEDKFVVIGDGDEVVNITLLWRDEIPDDWEQLPNAPSRRIAGMGPANMGNPDLAAIQTEQSITVSGYGALTVNNEPATIPDGYPPQGARLFVGFLGAKPEYTPHGLHKYEWDPEAGQFREAWVNTEVSSPNAVPYVSQGADLVYTCGARDGKWTIEALDWTTGEAAFHYVLGGNKYNSMFAGVTLDEEGRVLMGTMFGKVRIER
ncbi:MAG: hypothetical protein HKN26_07165 [Acidimicrobiales bacterium]|nr:hypothetical protein [Acidimicrobiales bacterium]